MRWSTSGLEVQGRKLPNRVLWSHGTGDSGKGLIAHLGAKLVASDVTSGGEATETIRINRNKGKQIGNKGVMVRTQETQLPAGF
jgi:hypothetical protein